MAKKRANEGADNASYLSPLVTRCQWLPIDLF